jgi:hypothetical protein
MPCSSRQCGAIVSVFHPVERAFVNGLIIPSRRFPRFPLSFADFPQALGRQNCRTTSFGQEQRQSIGVLRSGRELFCVFEDFTRRDLALFALAFAIAGCLMVWTINLSIYRSKDCSTPIGMETPPSLRVSI